MGIESTIGNAISGAATTAKIAARQGVNAVGGEIKDTITQGLNTGAPSDEVDAYASPPSGGSRMWNAAKSVGGKVVDAIAKSNAAVAVAKFAFDNRKKILQIVLAVGFVLLTSGFASAADKVKNDPIGFLANNSWCLYVEGKSALECVGCEALENKYGVDSASINCDQIVDATKGAQITR